MECGDAPWCELTEAIARCIEEVVAGGMLEVISWVPGVERDIGDWCAAGGHDLLTILVEGASTRFVIRKGQVE